MKLKISRQNLYQSIFSLRLSVIYIAAFVLLSGVCVEAFAQGGNYTTFDPPINTSISPTGITTAGEVVGYYTDSSNFNRHGFKWSNGVFTTIDSPGSLETYLNGVNTAGEVVGTYSTADGRSHGFKLNNGVFTTIDRPGSTTTYATGINTAGEVVGYYRDSTNSINHGFKWSNSVFTTIDPPGSVDTITSGINNAGEVFGYYNAINKSYGFKWSNGAFTIIDPPGSFNVYVSEINTAGETVGSYLTADSGNHGFKWSNGAFTIIDPPGSIGTYALGINTAGEVVGYYRDSSDIQYHGFKWSNGAFTIIDPPGSASTQATRINTAGEIVGTYRDVRGHGFKLSNNTSATLTATVQTNPAGRSFTVDGVTYNSTQTFNWQSSAAHTIGTTSPQTASTGTQYFWSKWSDGGAISHTVSPTANAAYTANFTDSLPQCIRPNLGWDFGDVLFGTSREKTFTYTNNLPISFTPQNYTLEGAADYCITNNTCENNLLAPGQSCSWTAKFTARAGGSRRNEEFNLFAKSGLSNGSDCTSLTGKGKLNPDQINPRLYQIDYPNIPYGYCTTLGQTPPYSIKNKGCALTSLANAINYILKSAPAPAILQTPPRLQDFIRSIDAYSHQTGSYCVSGPGNDVMFPKVVNNYPLTTASAEKALMWRSVSIKNDPAALTQILKEGYPVVVGIIQNVKKKKLPAKCDIAQPPADCFGNAHYVLAVGEDLQIIDPERSTNYSFQDLINYRATKGKTVVGWQTIGQVRVKDGAYDLPKQPRNCFSATLSGALCSEDISTIDGTSSNNSTQTTNSVSADVSDLNVAANDNVSFQIVDPQGRKTGYNSSTGQIEKAIPESDYYSENITGADEVETDNGSTTGTVSHPVNGTYQVIIKGDQTGSYSITINRSNRYAQSISPIELNGTIQAGETKTFTFNYSFSKNPVDFDNDGNSDISVFRPSNGVWYLNQSQNGFTGVQFGISSDKIVPADYDGDGKIDIAVYRAGTWYLQRSTAGFAGIQFGLSTDVPVPADYDGDGRAELAVYRPSNGTWYVLNLATNAFNAVQFGISSDKPVVADYDGDGKADYAVYRPDSGTWYILQSAKGFAAVQFGISTDKPVVGDYDGDGKADEAVYRPSNGTWYFLRSAQGFGAIQFGISSDLPVPADYDGDGKTDVAVYREGVWYQQKSTQGFAAVQFGVTSDKPAPNAFVP